MRLGFQRSLAATFRPLTTSTRSWPPAAPTFACWICRGAYHAELDWRPAEFRQRSTKGRAPSPHPAHPRASAHVRDSTTKPRSPALRLDHGPLLVLRLQRPTLLPTNLLQ